VLPTLVEAHPEAYGKMGLKDLCEGIHRVYRDDKVPKAQKDMYTTLPEMALRPADAYEQLVRGRALAGPARVDGDADLRADERNAGGQHACEQGQRSERDRERLAGRPDEFEGVPGVAEDVAESLEAGECTFGGRRACARAR